ncbi:MAG TPA: MMPL family transporter [Anaeromyxobacteraceae bacterium]|nr:MMPL family transporter [Anaeromyxobacteraceae bacterium]
MAPRPDLDAMPVVRSLAEFDPQSGMRFERLIFNRRRLVIGTLLAATMALAFCAVSKGVMNADFERMIPTHQPYIRNYLENKSELRGLGNSLHVVVENLRGDIYDPRYLESLRQISEELFLMPGVDRPWVKSLWTPGVRWNEVTEEGFRGGPVMPDSYDGSPASIEALRRNVQRAGIMGSLVARDLRSSDVFVPLLDRASGTGERLDYRRLSRSLEQLRARFEGKDSGVRVHIIGFGKLVGDLLEGVLQVAGYFAVAAGIAIAILFGYTRCWRSTLLVVGCSTVAVIWQVGLVSALGYELDPYSVLVPFLVFAIGVSHGTQKMNGILQDVARGTHRLVAARYTFRRLFLPGLTALLADAVGFAVLMTIDIPVIQQLAISASIGVGALILSNLILLPILLSYTGVGRTAAERALRKEGDPRTSWALRLLGRFTEPRWAAAAIALSAAMALWGWKTSLRLQIGDLEPGAPELRSTSRYNRDNAFVTANYGLSNDVFAVIVKTGREGCLKHPTLVEADRLGWALQQIPGVQATSSLADAVRVITAGSFEGNPKWLTLARNQDVLNYAAQQATTRNPDLFNADCSVMPVLAFLSDHKADTLERVVRVAEEFSARHGDDERQFLLAAGNAGIDAATNRVVRDASRTMMLWVYAAVAALCLITFRSWRATVVTIVPLAITSILCEALMVILGIGVKVATLPVIALGVGIGVDYALYLLSVQLALQRAGRPLGEAHRVSLRFTGKVVALVGVTLAAGVVTWAFSPIKFQADMGILLTFMFLWNMGGALVLMPALSRFLLAGVPAPRAYPVAEGVR